MKLYKVVAPDRDAYQVRRTPSIARVLLRGDKWYQCKGRVGNERV